MSCSSHAPCTIAVPSTSQVLRTSWLSKCLVQREEILGDLRACMGTKVIARGGQLFSIQNRVKYLLEPKVICELNNS